MQDNLITIALSIVIVPIVSIFVIWSLVFLPPYISILLVVSIFIKYLQCAPGTRRRRTMSGKDKPLPIEDADGQIVAEIQGEEDINDAGWE